MTIEQMKQKQATLIQEHRQAIANVHALDGGLQVLSEMIAAEEQAAAEQHELKE